MEPECTTEAPRYDDPHSRRSAPTTAQTVATTSSRREASEKPSQCSRASRLPSAVQAVVPPNESRPYRSHGAQKPSA